MRGLLALARVESSAHLAGDGDGGMKRCRRLPDEERLPTAQASCSAHGPAPPITASFLDIPTERRAAPSKTVAPPQEHSPCFIDLSARSPAGWSASRGETHGTSVPPLRPQLSSQRKIHHGEHRMAQQVEGLLPGAAKVPPPTNSPARLYSRLRDKIEES